MNQNHDQKPQVLSEPPRLRHRWLLLANFVNVYAGIYCFGIAIDTDVRALVPALLIAVGAVVTIRAEFKYEGWR
jgi:hypothetical protein